MSTLTTHSIVRRPIDTEKTRALKETQNMYLFEVDRRANKLEIKHAVEKLFGVKVDMVRTMIVRGKYKRVRNDYGKRPNWKKAYVKLKQGESISLFEGV